MNRIGGLVVTALLIALCAPLAAEDHVLVLGGGPTPQSSQMSIEQNVLFLKRSLVEMGRNDIDPTVLFASGASALPDVCFEQSDEVPRAYRLLAEILGTTKGIQLGYRCHQIPDVDGASDRATVFQQLSEHARQLKKGDRLFLYVSGHGGKGEPTTNGYVETWKHGDIRVRDLGEMLDRFDPEVEVIVLMVQCYSGSFANIIFERGDPSRPIAPHRRAGFFATIESRPAAGCTPDTRIDQYQEYTTSFLGALAGRDRSGGSVATHDINGDGVISLAEAHAHAMINSPTIDVSLRTSDRFLETMAQISTKDLEERLSTRSIESLLAKADPVRSHILGTLAKQLGYQPDQTLADAEKESTRLEVQRRQMRAVIHQFSDTRDSISRQMERNVLDRWPFLQNPWHPQAHVLLTSRSDELLAYLQAQPNFSSWDRLRDRIDAMKKSDLDREKRWARLQRLLLTARTILWAEELDASSSPEVQDQYRNILALEDSVLHAGAFAGNSLRAN